MRCRVDLNLCDILILDGTAVRGSVISSETRQKPDYICLFDPSGARVAGSRRLLTVRKKNYSRMCDTIVCHSPLTRYLMFRYPLLARFLRRLVNLSMQAGPSMVDLQVTVARDTRGAMDTCHCASTTCGNSRLVLYHGTIDCAGSTVLQGVVLTATSAYHRRDTGVRIRAVLVKVPFSEKRRSYIFFVRKRYKKSMRYQNPMGASCTTRDVHCASIH